MNESYQTNEGQYHERNFLLYNLSDAAYHKFQKFLYSSTSQSEMCNYLLQTPRMYLPVHALTVDLSEGDILEIGAKSFSTYLGYFHTSYVFS